MKRLLLLGSLAITPVLVLACSDDDGEEDVPEDGASAEEQTVDVTASDFAFEPTEISVDPGQSVTIALANAGDAGHTFTIDGVDFEIEAEGGASAEGTFTAPDDSVRFYCRFHPDQMTGSISLSGPATDATDGATPDDTDDQTDGATPDETEDDETDGATPDDTDDDDDNGGDNSGPGSGGYGY